MAAMRRHGLDTVFLAAPTSTPQRRLRLVARYSTGFVYLVSRTGVTGERDFAVGRGRAAGSLDARSTDLPLAVGFGISQPGARGGTGRAGGGRGGGQRYRADLIEENADNPRSKSELESFARELKHGFDWRE